MNDEVLAVVKKQVENYMMYFNAIGKENREEELSCKVADYKKGLAGGCVIMCNLAQNLLQNLLDFIDENAEVKNESK